MSSPLSDRPCTDDALARYFRELFHYSVAVLGRLPIRLTPQPMSYVSEVLDRAANERRAEETARLAALPRVRPPPEDAEQAPVGLNTIGILADRLSILAIKSWFLRNKHGRAEDAERLFNVDVEQVVQAMCRARPGSSTLLTKVTALKADIHAADWNECYYGLLASNLMMWEAQESMYVNNMEDYGADEVRACLTWCSYGNLRRNNYIRACEIEYWRDSETFEPRATTEPQTEATYEPKVLERRRTVISPYVVLSERLVRLPGKDAPQLFHSLSQADYVSVLAQTGDRKILLVRQFRPPVEAMTLELPSGLLESGEDPAVCAARELEEEVGFRTVGPLRFLGKVRPDVGRLDNALWAFFASDIEPVPGWAPEPGITRLFVSREEFDQLFARGELVNAPQMGVVALAQARGYF